MNLPDLALASAVGGLLCVERKSLGQFMLARPIVVAPIVAALLGDARNGLYVGIPLELFFLGSTSYGASTPEHETLAALSAASMASAAAGESVAPAWALAIAAFVSLPMARLGRRVEAWMERRSEAYVDRAEEDVEAGRLGRASRQALVAMLWTFALGAAVTAAGAFLGRPLAFAEGQIPESGHHALTLAWSLFVGVSAAIGLRAIQTSGGPLLSGVAALTVFAVFALSTFALG